MLLRMKTTTKRLAILLLAGIVLASGAYAAGSQSGGGGALASGSNASAGNAASGTSVADRRGPGSVRGLRRGARDLGLDALARKLGVTTATLGDALRAIRDETTPQQRRDQAIRALATALGKPVDQVTGAVDSVLPARGAGAGRFGDAFAAALAKALGVDRAKVQAGLDDARRDLRAGRDRRAFPDTLVGDVAAATGVDAARVRAALRSLRPGRGHRRDGRGDIRPKLATALGVTTARLDAAFATVRAQARERFATELAQKLGVDVQKVEDALASLPGPGRRHP